MKRGKLVPVAEGLEATPAGGPKESFAIIGRSQMGDLAKAMPDAQSAVLFVLAWHAAVQLRMKRGPLSGQRLARVSARRLSQLADRPLRTVRHALAALKAAGKIRRVDAAVGRTAVYEVIAG